MHWIIQMCHILITGRSFDVNQVSGGSQNRVLFDFTHPNVSTIDWLESSDTVRVPGKSKALITMQKAQLFQRAVFFALLNPQPNGAGFAGVNTDTNLDLSQCSAIDMKIRAQGQYSGFKVVLMHHGEGGSNVTTYEQFFQAPSEFQVVSLPLSDFKPYYRGALVNNTIPLDTSDITRFGIQFYGGVYSNVKQSGPATLEIDWIKASAWLCLENWQRKTQKFFP